MRDILFKPWYGIRVHRFLRQAFSHRIDMEAVRVTLILRFDEVYKRLPITTDLFDEIHIADDSSICESLHCILEAYNWGDLSEFPSKFDLSQLLVYMLVSYTSFRFVPSREVRRPSTRC